MPDAHIHTHKTVTFQASNKVAILVQVHVYLISIFMCTVVICVYVNLRSSFFTVISCTHFHMACCGHTLPTFRLWWSHHSMIILMVAVGTAIGQPLSKRSS